MASMKKMASPVAFAGWLKVQSQKFVCGYVITGHDALMTEGVPAALDFCKSDALALIAIEIPSEGNADDGDEDEAVVVLHTVNGLKGRGIGCMRPHG